MYSNAGRNVGAMEKPHGFVTEALRYSEDLRSSLGVSRPVFLWKGQLCIGKKEPAMKGTATGYACNKETLQHRINPFSNSWHSMRPARILKGRS